MSGSIAMRAAARVARLAMRSVMPAVLSAACVMPALAGTLPSFDAVKRAHQASDVTLRDRQGTPIQTVRVDMRVRRLPWVPLQDVSPALLRAIVLSEDQRFYEHSGVDWSAVANSAFGNLWNTKTRGASTLTMQLAGLLDDDLARPSGGRSVTQKLGQVLVAKRLEAEWQKRQILEAYLNEVAWRGEVVGIGALSQTLFGKLPSGLDAQESAIAAALLRGPNAGSDAVATRACGVLKLQASPCAGVAALTERALAKRGGMPLGEQLAPHFARQWLASRSTSLAASSAAIDTASSKPLRTTIDARLQRLAIAALRQQLAELTGRNVGDGAVLVLDNRSGEVLAWVGSSGGDFSDAAQVDGVLARRQPGSTLKPFVYGLAFERKLITPASLIDDAPAQIATSNGLYQPQNYDHDFKGWVSARTALAASLNVPAVRVGAMLGVDALFTRLQALGFALPESGGYYGPSLALGSADVSLLALTNAYRSLANGGLYSAVALGSTAAAPRRVADAAATYLVGDVLSDNNARVRTFGLDSVLATRGWAAVKTGTSKDMRDNWCVGYTDRYTVGVWVGNASGEPMHQVSGVSGAAPVWQSIVRALHEGSPSRRPAMPAGVASAHVAFDAALEAPRDELFIAGTQARPAIASKATAPQGFGIRSPRDGSIYALDPDMPPAAQRIVFEGEPGRWMLDGKRIGSGPRVHWAPWPGRHALSLVGVEGTVLQSLRFEVRGAGLKTSTAAR